MTSFVLIPGAGGAAWYWHRVVPLLRDAGHDAVAVDLPADDETAGLPEYARLALDATGGRDDVVLVAQSLGAFTAPLVATAVALRGLVLVNAMIPVPGETPGDWWEATGWDDARVAAARAAGYSTDFDLAVYFLHDVPPDVPAARGRRGVQVGVRLRRLAGHTDPGRGRRGRPVLPRRLPAEGGQRTARRRAGRAAGRSPHRALSARPGGRLPAQHVTSGAQPGRFSMSNGRPFCGPALAPFAS